LTWLIEYILDLEKWVNFKVLNLAMLVLEIV